jgi:hypothetical protein
MRLQPIDRRYRTTLQSRWCKPVICFFNNDSNAPVERPDAGLDGDGRGDP